MRITLNDRSTKQLLQVMDAYGFSSPTHCVQVMIGKLIPQLEAGQHPTNQTKPIPTCEDESNVSKQHQNPQQGQLKE